MRWWPRPSRETVNAVAVACAGVLRACTAAGMRGVRRGVAGGTPGTGSVAGPRVERRRVQDPVYVDRCFFVQ
jgi:hypothetical protein